MAPFHIMHKQDAIVGLFCTPPPVKYFSMRSYIGFRFKPSAWLPAVELADPASNAVINTTARLAPDEEGQQNPFRRTALFISTADGVTARCVDVVLSWRVLCVPVKTVI